MPNNWNVDSPITLLGFYRSGTTLLSQILAQHPDVAVVHETSNLIFGTWHALEIDTLADLQHRLTLSRQLSEDLGSFRARLIRNLFVEAFPDARPRWFHKPIGIPHALLAKYLDSEMDAAIDWYWHVLNNAFPRAQYVTILRHPLDVALSTRDRFGWSEETIWSRMALTARILTHAKSKVDFVVHFDELVNNSEMVVRKLCNAFGLDFHPSMVKPLQKRYAAAKGRENIEPGNVSRRSDWGRLNTSSVAPRNILAIQTLLEKYSAQLEHTWVTLVQQASAVANDSAYDFASVGPPSVDEQIHRIHYEWAERLHTQARAFELRISKLQDENRRLMSEIKRQSCETAV